MSRSHLKVPHALGKKSLARKGDEMVSLVSIW